MFFCCFTSFYFDLEAAFEDLALLIMLPAARMAMNARAVTLMIMFWMASLVFFLNMKVSPYEYTEVGYLRKV